MVQQLSARGTVVWTLPGGGIEANESAAVAAVRELEEETGLVGAVVRQLVHAPDPIFLVDVDTAAEPAVGDDADLIAVAWRPLAEVELDLQVRLVIAALHIDGSFDVR